ncbi:hypothetical protein B0H14DRAFT_3173381 [Mycena olivaceomarginata]|nr:hypothetical protein B0H14DRAFT_3173381 [Mycena olivaceomarginata]
MTTGGQRSPVGSTQCMGPLEAGGGQRRSPTSVNRQKGRKPGGSHRITVVFVGCQCCCLLNLVTAGGGHRFSTTSVSRQKGAKTSGSHRNTMTRRWVERWRPLRAAGPQGLMPCGHITARRRQNAGAAANPEELDPAEGSAVASPPRFSYRNCPDISLRVVGAAALPQIVHRVLHAAETAAASALPPPHRPPPAARHASVPPVHVIASPHQCVTASPPPTCSVLRVTPSRVRVERRPQERMPACGLLHWRLCQFHIARTRIGAPRLVMRRSSVPSDVRRAAAPSCRLPPPSSTVRLAMHCALAALPHHLYPRTGCSTQFASCRVSFGMGLFAGAGNWACGVRLGVGTRVGSGRLWVGNECQHMVEIQTVNLLMHVDWYPADVGKCHQSMRGTPGAVVILLRTFAWSVIGETFAMTHCRWITKIFIHLKERFHSIFLLPILEALDEQWIARECRFRPGGRVDLNTLGDDVWREQFRTVYSARRSIVGPSDYGEKPLSCNNKRAIGAQSLLSFAPHGNATTRGGPWEISGNCGLHIELHEAADLPTYNRAPLRYLGKKEEFLAKSTALPGEKQPSVYMPCLDGVATK